MGKRKRIEKEDKKDRKVRKRFTKLCNKILRFLYRNGEYDRYHFHEFIRLNT